ncbi:delta-60 repeat domain-containing protein [Delftia sp. PS-11]|uniref:delta-60 repeat domain-containing protein n=1 Tax=Delftia sp. PS-11 TaxID=2767222 RepID=UPI0024545DF2|nr:delta-60 repeat domain-containing protein [Delftia sp. PS-11]KAJ8738086.1 hypothetical protein H9T68_24590 [Delftia sp. PS-11]
MSIHPSGSGWGSGWGGSVICQPDGKIVLVGTSSNGSNNDFSLIRLNPDGSLDRFFGIDKTGKLMVPVGSGDDFGSSIALQSDGKIVVAGVSGNASGLTDFSLIRLHTDGSLDTSFGPGGKGTLLVPVSNGYNIGGGVVLQPDGKIVVAGSSYNGNDKDFSLIRLDPDGSLDKSFGDQGTGKQMISVGSKIDEAYSVILQPDGKIVVAGSSGDSSVRDISLIRLNPDGLLDTSFGSLGTGTLRIPVGSGYDLGRSVILQSDGKILG